MKRLLINLILIQTSIFAVAQIAFDNYRINNLGYISIPSNMEEQSGTYKVMAQKIQQQYAKTLNYEIDFSNRIVFQQQGPNSFQKSSTYARIIIKTILGNTADYKRLSHKPSLSASEIQKLSNQAKTELENGFKETQQNQKIISWYGLSIVTVNDVSAYKYSYVRQLGNNPPVYVEIYKYENYDRTHELVLSYRLEDSAIWKPLFNKVLNSFVITPIK